MVPCFERNVSRRKSLRVTRRDCGCCSCHRTVVSFRFPLLSPPTLMAHAFNIRLTPKLVAQPLNRRSNNQRKHHQSLLKKNHLERAADQALDTQPISLFTTGIFFKGIITARQMKRVTTEIKGTPMMEFTVLLLISKPKYPL